MRKDGHYCVYEHATLDGEVVYVGMGTISRAHNTTGRKADHAKWLRGPHVVVVLATDLTEEAAQALEKTMIDQLQPQYNRRSGVLSYDEYRASRRAA